MSSAIEIRCGFISIPVTSARNLETNNEKKPQLDPISNADFVVDRYLSILYRSNLFSVGLHPSI